MADRARLLAHATGAFIDRTPIDWPALLSRVRQSPDRVLFENLYAVSTVRARARAASAPIESSRASAAAWAVVALGSVETVLLLAAVARAFSMGASIGIRTPQLILALAFAAASARLGAATFRDPRSLFLLATFTAVASIFAQSAASGLTTPWWPVDWLLQGVWIDAFLPACLWQFALGFPRVRRFTRFDRFARLAVAALWILGTMFFVLNLLVRRLAIDAGPFAFVSPAHSSYLSWRVFSLLLTGALLAILVRARRAPARERRKVARLAQAIGVGLGPFLLFAIVRTAIPAVEEWFKAPGSSGVAWLYGLIVAALAATPILSTAAVLVDRPFEFQAAFGQRTGWLGVLGSRTPRGGRHDDGRVARAMERLSRTRGRREAIACLSREIAGLTGANHVGILLPDQDGGFVEWPNAADILRPNCGLAVLIRQAEEPVDVSTTGALFALLPREDRDWATANAVDLIAPLKRGDGGVTAVVTVGPKANGATFDGRDRWLTVALMAAAAAAFDDDRHSTMPSLDPSRHAAPAAVLGEVAFECPLCGIVAASAPLPCGCGSATTLAALPYSVADKFHVKRRIGSGGMGVVYLARDAVLDRDVALKTLPSLRPRAVERLRDEARAMAALNHESLATLYGLEIWRGTPILVVEYFPNGTLASRLSGGPLSPVEAVTLGIRLARALVYMHARAVLHRDLKPSNIAFTASGDAKLLDFGLATLSSPDVDAEPADSGGTTGEPFIGTRGYAPPETLRGEPSSPSGDRWALAVVLVEAACGANPFAAGHRRATRREATRADLSEICSAKLRTVPELRAFLERALAPSPEHRFPTSGDFLAGLEVIAATLELRPAQVR
jgi:hypothetical protein